MDVSGTGFGFFVSFGGEPPKKAKKKKQPKDDFYGGFPNYSYSAPSKPVDVFTPATNAASEKTPSSSYGSQQLLTPPPSPKAENKAEQKKS